MSKRSVVVVGLGSIGRRHARLLAERPDLAVSACEPDPRMVKLLADEAPGIPASGEFEAVLAAGPDFMVIATPHQLHRSQAIAALQAGIPVLCEKPMAADLSEARDLLEVSCRVGPPLAFGFMLHFHPLLLRVKELIDSDQLGTVVQARYVVGSLITLRNSASRYQEKLRGALLMDYAHQPDLLYWLLGKAPAGVYLHGVQGGAPELTSNPNALSLVCDYREPLVTSIDLNYLQLPQRNEGEIIGDRASVRFNLDTQQLTINRVATGDEVTEQFTLDRDDLYRREHTAFLAAIDGLAPPASPADEAIISMHIIEAALRSGRETRRVALSELTG